MIPLVYFEWMLFCFYVIFWSFPLKFIISIFRLLIFLHRLDLFCFQLSTENLHLNFRVDQHYSRHDLPTNSSAYAVGPPVVALVEIVELFEQSEYRYCWTVDGNSTCSRFPNHTVNFNSSGEHKIGIVTYASINLTDNDGNFHIDERISENITKIITMLKGTYLTILKPLTYSL